MNIKLRRIGKALAIARLYVEHCAIFGLSYYEIIIKQAEIGCQARKLRMTPFPLFRLDGTIDQRRAKRYKRQQEKGTVLTIKCLDPDEFSESFIKNLDAIILSCKAEK